MRAGTKHGNMEQNKGTSMTHMTWTTDIITGSFPDEWPTQLTPLSFGRDVKIGVPCLVVACMPNLAENAKHNSLCKIK